MRRGNFDQIDESKKKRIKASNATSPASEALARPNASKKAEVEEFYSKRSRKTGSEVVHEALPIKKGGVIHRVSRKVAQDLPLDSNMEEEEEDSAVRDELRDRARTPTEKLMTLKEDIAKHATQLQELPEENISSLTTLCRYASSHEEVESLLAIAALVPVFKSLAPSYKIRPLSETERKEKVSREVAKQRDFEESFVKNYRTFIDRLTFLSRGTQKSQLGNDLSSLLETTSISASCELCLSSLRHFNFNEELFSILIRSFGRKPKDADTTRQFTHCVRTIETLLKDDGDQGEISLKITKILCSRIKTVKFRVDESVLNVFLSLSILENANPFASNSLNQTAPTGKKLRVHLSKKERKARKDAKAINEEMKKAEQAVSAKDRINFQAQILQSVFKLYLEILRSSLLELTDGRMLVAAVLEGLSRFGPMANVDLVGDFLEVLKELIDNIIWEQESESNMRTSTRGIFTAENIRKMLLCVATAFALISNHTENGKLPFPVDLSRFVETLYVILPDIALDPNLELSSKSLRLEDPLGEKSGEEKPAVNVSTRAELLLKCLDFIFFRSKSGSNTRAMLFLKRIFMMSLHTPEKTTNTNFKFVSKLMHRYGNFLNTLWSTEDKVEEDSAFSLGYEHVSTDLRMKTSNAHGATLWENIIYETHYCQTHRDLSRSLAKLSK